MQLQSLTLTDYRNYREQSWTLHDGVNILIGENAQGKTNALEAIYFLAMGKSHRTSRDTDIIRFGAEQATVEAQLIRQQRPMELALRLSPTGKRATINGVPMSKMTDFIGHFQVVLFAPEDLALVKGSPGGRRRFIDMELGQTQAMYLHHLAQYQRVLQQRNALLKQPDVDFGYIEIFDEQLVSHGVEVLLRRRQFVQYLRKVSQDIYASISSEREKLEIGYVSTVPGFDDRHKGRPRNAAVASGEANSSTLDDEAKPHTPTAGTAHEDVEMLTKSYLRALKTKQQTDRHMGYTTVGPHRDDLVFTLDGQPVQAYASQGQQRSIALSLRLAEIDFIHQEVGEYPVLLLDDVLSELDDLRQRQLILSMSERVQTIITTTTLFQLQGQLRDVARLFHVRSGIIQEEG